MPHIKSLKGKAETMGDVLNHHRHSGEMMMDVSI
jgi:hypothetical protein